MFKKIIAVFLCLILSLSCFAVAASAEETAAEPEIAFEEYEADDASEDDYDPWGGYSGNVLRAAELVPFSLLCFIASPFLFAIPPVGLASLFLPFIAIGNFFSALVTGRSGF